MVLCVSCMSFRKNFPDYSFSLVSETKKEKDYLHWGLFTNAVRLHIMNQGRERPR